MAVARPRILPLALLVIAAFVLIAAVPAWCAVARADRLLTAAGPTPSSPARPPVIVSRSVNCTLFGPRLAADFGAAYSWDIREEISDPNGLSDIILATVTVPDGPLYKLYDDGTHGDMTPGDGTFQQRWLAVVPPTPGDYFFFADDSKKLSDAVWDTLYPESDFPFPSVPTPLSPVHGATMQTTTPLFTWESSINAAAGYAIWIWDELPLGIDWSWSHVVWYADDLTDTSITVPAGILVPGHTYYWWVTAENRDVVEGNSRYAAEYASFSVDTSGAIAGQVRAGGADVADAIVQAYSGDQLQGSAATGPNGVYAIAGLPEGQYVVVAQEQGYVSESKANITVTRCQTTYVNFTLQISGRLKGQVTDWVTGATLIGATVTARSGGVLRATAVTAAPWSIYEIDSGLPAGTYSMNASAPGYLDQGKIGISVTGGATTYVNFRLAPPPSLKGQVRDRATGAAIIGATVQAYMGGVLRGTATTVSPWGIYEMYGLLAGTYSVNASKAGYTDQSKIGVAVTAGITRYVNFNLEPQ